MVLEALSAVQARIAQIQSLAPAAPHTTLAPAGLAAGQASFDTVLNNTLRAADPAAPVEAAPMSGVNGRLSDGDLAPIGVGEYRLAQPAAAAFRRMRAAAAAAGVDIGVRSAYRTYDQQVEIVKKEGLYSNGGLAAAPGKSQHGWGLAVDVNVDSAGQQWLRANGAEFGFFEDVAREPWHWEYQHGRS